MSVVNIGIVGAGWVVQNRHLPGLKGTSEARVGKIWSRDPEKARGVADDFDIPESSAKVGTSGRHDAA